MKQIPKNPAWLILMLAFTAWVGRADVSIQTVFDKSVQGSGPSTIIEGIDGMLYGTTVQGNGGTVFRVRTDGSLYTILRELGTNSARPLNPNSLVQNETGVLFGTTSYWEKTGILGDSSRGNGMIYRLNPDGSHFSVLHEFSPDDGDGYWPGNLVYGPDGVLYGTTGHGGPDINLPGYFDPIGQTIFRINPDGSGYRVLYRFGTGPNDGVVPTSLIVGKIDGMLYGTALYGGTDGNGTVFRINRDGTGYQILRQFTAVEGPGYQPSALVEDSTGILYGATLYGGIPGGGVLFRMHRDGTGYTVICQFDEVEHLTTDRFYEWFPNPYVNPYLLSLGSNGVLYGAAYVDAAFIPSSSGSEGMTFSVNRDGSGFSVLHRSIDYREIAPEALHLGKAAEIYEVGRFSAQLNALSLTGSDFRSLFSFSDASSVSDYLIDQSDGMIYGAVGRQYGMPSEIVRIAQGGIPYTVLHQFQGTNGGTIIPGQLLRGSDARLYGATTVMGADQSPQPGEIFAVARDGIGFTSLHLFDIAAGEGTHADVLVEGNDGFIYGATPDGGSVTNTGAILTANGNGVLFKIKRDGTSFQVLHVFSTTDGGGYDPVSLSVGPDNSIFGLTSRDDANTNINLIHFGGVLFKLAPDGTGYQILHTFTGTNGDGGVPNSIILGKDGSYYGLTSFGGQVDSDIGVGTLFRINADGTGYAVVRTLDDSPLPYGLIQGDDGVLYGTSDYEYDGAIFKLKPDGSEYGECDLLTTALNPHVSIPRSDGALYATTSSSIIRVAASPTGSPAILSLARTVIAGQGSSPSLGFAIFGGTNFAYQWRFNGANIPGATGLTLTLTNISATSAGGYDLVVFGGGNAVTSSVAPVSVAGIHADGRQPATVSVDGPIGGQFRIQYTDRLVYSDWRYLTDIVLASPHIDISDPDSTNNSSRFYRIFPRQ